MVIWFYKALAHYLLDIIRSLAFKNMQSVEWYIKNKWLNHHRLFVQVYIYIISPGCLPAYLLDCQPASFAKIHIFNWLNVSGFYMCKLVVSCACVCVLSAYTHIQNNANKLSTHTNHCQYIIHVYIHIYESKTHIWHGTETGVLKEMKLNENENVIDTHKQIHGWVNWQYAL